MRLNKESINKLRKELEIELAKVKENHSVILPVDILRELIFEKCSFRTNKGFVTYPGWSGPFLRKLDLSKLSFDGVCLDYNLILNRMKTIDEQVKKEEEEFHKKNEEEKMRRKTASIYEDDYDDERTTYYQYQVFSIL